MPTHKDFTAISPGIIKDVKYIGNTFEIARDLFRSLDIYLDLNDIALTPLPEFHDDTQWDCSLAGYILNENNEPMAGAAVNALVGEERFETTSDSNAWYELTNLPNNVATQIVPYFDSYGYNLFGYDRPDCNCRLDIQIFPQAYDWYDTPAPPLLVRDWLNSDPLDLDTLNGNVILLCLGLDLEDEKRLQKIRDIDEHFSDMNDVVVIGVHEYIEPNAPKEEALLQLIEQQQVNLPIAIDEHMDVAQELMLPDVRDLQPGAISIKIRRLKQSGATHSLYEVRQTPAYFLIDKDGLLRASIPEKDIVMQIEELSGS